MPRTSAFSPREAFYWVADFALSGPLIFSLGMGLGFVASPDSMFGPGHDKALELASSEQWAVMFFAAFFLGHAGRLLGHRAAWLWAHAMTVTLFVFLGGSFVLTALHEGWGGLPFGLGVLFLAFHALSRSTGHYHAVFRNERYDSRRL